MSNMNSLKLFHRPASISANWFTCLCSIRVILKILFISPICQRINPFCLTTHSWYSDLPDHFNLTFLVLLSWSSYHQLCRESSRHLTSGLCIVFHFVDVIHATSGVSESGYPFRKALRGVRTHVAMRRFMLTNLVFAWNDPSQSLILKKQINQTISLSYCIQSVSSGLPWTLLYVDYLHGEASTSSFLYWIPVLNYEYVLGSDHQEGRACAFRVVSGPYSWRYQSEEKRWLSKSDCIFLRDRQLICIVYYTQSVAVRRTRTKWYKGSSSM